MPSHWTYEAVTPDEDLQQGDILRPSEGLCAVLSQYHSHFVNDKYTGYFVATQSCDLVRRTARADAKAPYIGIAVIRPMSQIRRKLLSTAIRGEGGGVFRKGNEEQAKQFFARLLNQNEQALGLFYLHSDSDAGVDEESVAFLRVTVSVRSEHYERLLEARQGRLTPEFRAKLGWLLGNLYGRPATRDWGDDAVGDSDFKALLKRFVGGEGLDTSVRWIDDEVVDAAAQAGLDLSSADDEELEGLRPLPRRERALQEIADAIARIAPEITPVQLQKVQNRLLNNGKFTKLFR